MPITRLMFMALSLIAAMPAARAANLVVNGDFEGYGGGYTVSDQGLNG